MIFTETKLKGAFVIEPERQEDARGFFARTWCRREFQERGLDVDWAQSNISFNKQRDTLRGMHYQTQPHEETKLVRCTMGAIFDVIVDLRRDSQTFGQWTAAELTASNRRMLYVPRGMAHGFETLMDDTEVFYEMSDFYSAGASRGVRWNDPAFSIEWPNQPRLVSSRDLNFPLFVIPGGNGA